MKKTPTSLIISTIALIILFILNFAPVINISNDLNTLLTLFTALAFTIAHGSQALGWRNLIIFILVTFVLSFTSEALGVATGLVFGPYYYTDLLGPKILGVPPMIQVGYIASGYASLMMARVILGLVGPIKKGASILAASLVGAFIMVSWDVAMDPFQSTVGGDWIWTTGGPYFGIGIHNYIGWFGTVFLFMLVYQLIAKNYPEKISKAVASSKYFWSQPALYYAFLALGMVIVPFVGGVSQPYATPQNYNGSVETLTQSMALIAFFVMGTPALISLCRLWITPKSISSVESK